MKAENMKTERPAEVRIDQKMEEWTLQKTGAEADTEAGTETEAETETEMEQGTGTEKEPGVESEALKTGLVFCGGSISEGLLPWIRQVISRKPAYLVAADRGLVFLDRHQMIPDLVVGDFDSSPSGYIEAYRQRHPEVQVRTYNPEKDYTDSEIGARAAADAGCGKVILIGATGTRLDHVLGNVQVLAMLLDRGIRGAIIDPCNRITLHGGPMGGGLSIRRKDQWGKYVSLFAFGGDVTGLTLSGFHYPVSDFHLTAIGSRAVSNEIDDEEGNISFRRGMLLVIESRDEA